MGPNDSAFDSTHNFWRGKLIGKVAKYGLKCQEQLVVIDVIGVSNLICIAPYSPKIQRRFATG